MRNIFSCRQLFGVTLSLAALASTSLAATPAHAAPFADLSIQISGPSQITSTASTVRYNVRLTNAGPSSVLRPTFIMAAPPAGRMISVSPMTDGRCTMTATGASCTLSGSLAKGASSQVTMDVDVTMTNRNACINPSAKTPQIARAIVQNDTTKYIDPNIANNISSTQFVVNCVVVNQLTVQQTAMLLTGAVVRSAKDVPLLRFRAMADTESIALTSLSFDAKQGSLLNAQNYTLMVDTNNDGIVDTAVQKGVLATAGMVTFNKLTNGSFIISARQTVLFEVRGDIVATPASASLQLKFATSNPSYITAKRVLDSRTLSGIKTDGICASTCETTVTTATATLWNIVSQGNLFLTASATPVSSHQMLGGTLSDDVLRLSFRADTEDIAVTKLVMTATGADASSLARTITSLALFKPGSTVPFAIATVASCGTDSVPFFSMCATMNARELVIAKDTSTEVIVRAQVKTDSDGAVSGKRFVFMIDAIKGAQARGIVSGNKLFDNDRDFLAEGEVFIGTSMPGSSRAMYSTMHVVVLSKIAKIANADASASGTAIPTGTNRAIGSFSFAAAPHTNVLNGLNRATIDAITYTVRVTNVDLDPASFVTYNAFDPFTTVPCTLSAASTATVQFVVCSGLVAAGMDTAIPAGDAYTFVLRSTVRNARVNPSLPSSLQVSLDSYANSAADMGGSHIRWIDTDTASAVPFLWIESTDAVVNSTLYKN